MHSTFEKGDAQRCMHLCIWLQSWLCGGGEGDAQAVAVTASKSAGFMGDAQMHEMHPYGKVRYTELRGPKAVGQAPWLKMILSFLQQAVTRPKRTERC